MNAQQLDRYLERIGYTGSRELTAENLDALIKAHISAVPFENITVYDFDQVPSLDPEDLYKKIVEDRRGGYCFELNTSLHHLLTAFGFEAFPIVVRIVVMGGPLRPYAHKGVIAMAEGRKWYCDVGYGGPGPKGALEISAREQEIGGVPYRCFFRENDLIVQKKEEDGGWLNVLIFAVRPIEPCDFIPLNYYIACNPTSVFRDHRIANLTLPDGSKALTGNHYTFRRAGTVIERDCADKKEVEALLREEFGIDVRLPD